MVLFRYIDHFQWGLGSFDAKGVQFPISFKVNYRVSFCIRNLSNKDQWIQNPYLYSFTNLKISFYCDTNTDMFCDFICIGI